MQQHEEAFCEIFFPLAHRTGDVHQAEHHGLRIRQRLWIEPVEPDVDGVDITDDPPAPDEQGEPVAQFGEAGRRLFAQLGLGFEPGNLLGEGVELNLFRPAQRKAPAEAVAHGAADIDVGRRARGGEPRAPWLEGDRFLQVQLDHVGQFEILEEQVEELFARQHEAEIVLAVAVAGLALAGTARAALAAGFRQPVAGDEFLVARQDMVAPATAGRVLEARLGRALDRNAHRMVAVDVSDLAGRDLVVDDALEFVARPPQEALAIAQALVLRIQAPIDIVRHAD